MKLHVLYKELLNAKLTSWVISRNVYLANMLLDAVGLFSWDYVKGCVYKNNLELIIQQNNEIIRVIEQKMSLEILTKAWVSVELQEMAMCLILFFIYKYHNYYFSY